MEGGKGVSSFFFVAILAELNKGGFEGFLSGYTPSIGEESIPHHVEVKTYQILKGEESQKEKCHKIYC